jgi:hypothetical protein
LNTPQTQTKAYEPSQATQAESPLKHVTPNTPANFSDKENLSTPNATVKSKKRGIEEVDGAETVESAKMLAHVRDQSSSNTGMRLTTDAIQKHTVSSPPSTHLHMTNNFLRKTTPLDLQTPDLLPNAQRPHLRPSLSLN